MDSGYRKNVIRFFPTQLETVNQRMIYRGISLYIAFWLGVSRCTGLMPNFTSNTIDFPWSYQQPYMISWGMEVNSLKIAQCYKRNFAMIHNLGSRHLNLFWEILTCYYTTNSH